MVALPWKVFDIELRASPGAPGCQIFTMGQLAFLLRAREHDKKQQDRFYSTRVSWTGEKLMVLLVRSGEDKGVCCPPWQATETWGVKLRHREGTLRDVKDSWIPIPLLNTSFVVQSSRTHCSTQRKGDWYEISAGDASRPCPDPGGTNKLQTLCKPSATWLHQAVKQNTGKDRIH